MLPVGATRPVSFQARLVTATNKDLLAEVAAGRFREDLYYRLNVVSIHLPPLRDRREDIPELVSVLLAKHAARLGKHVQGVDNATVRGLMAAPWKGNVRELDNALERAVILGDGPDPHARRLPSRPDDRDRFRERRRRATTSAPRSASTSATTFSACSRTAATTSARPPAASAWDSPRSTASSRSSTFDQHSLTSHARHD